MIESFQKLNEIGLLTVVLVVMNLMILINALFKTWQDFKKNTGIMTRQSLKEETQEKTLGEHEEHFEKLDKQITEMRQSIEQIMAANRVSLGSKINDKYKDYLQKGYIPQDEYDEFIDLHDAYKGVKGNHSGDAKFKYIKENLEIKPDEAVVEKVVENERKTKEKKGENI